MKVAIWWLSGFPN